MRLGCFFAALCILCCTAAAPSAATSTYNYGPDEYVIVAGGMAPDGKHSIAAHGHGEGGDQDFHLYLMAEPGHHKIGPLEEVECRLDSGPNAFDASWSQDSRFVALGYRLERHLYAFNNIYRIGKGRAYPIAGPTVLEAMGANTRETKHVDFRDANEQLAWLGPGRFHLSGTGTIVAPPELARTLRKYGKQVDGPVPRHDDSVFIEYQGRN